MEEQKPAQLQIEIDDNTAQGTYSNLAMIGHSENEFIIDFIFAQPQAPKAKVRSRIITSPAHAKRFLSAMKENIEKFEARFGEIKTTVIQDPKRVGFYN